LALFKVNGIQLELLLVTLVTCHTMRWFQLIRTGLDAIGKIFPDNLFCWGSRTPIRGRPV